MAIKLEYPPRKRYYRYDIGPLTEAQMCTLETFCEQRRFDYVKLDTWPVDADDQSKRHTEVETVHAQS